MANNPLQQFFRQPKIYVGLPSGGIYNRPGAIDGDTTRIPVYGMTGMDEIVLKTPDALLSGESTVRVIQSCCPSIKDAWDLSNLDTDMILTAIRVATFGSDLTVGSICENCNTENEYTLDLTKMIEHYSSCKYDNQLVVDDLKITVRPLNYKRSTDFQLRNFQLQQQLKHINSLESEEEKVKETAKIFQELAVLKNEIFASGIESVDTGHVVVTERPFIIEWLENVDRNVVEKIREHIEKNQKTWATPVHLVKCDHCGHESTLSITLDESNFFVVA